MVFRFSLGRPCKTLTYHTNQNRNVMKKMVSAGLLIGGLILLYFGYQEYQSVTSEVEEFFTGSPNSNAVWMITGGAVATIAGMVGLLPKNRN